jgi:preprotein translocase subunit SecF
VPFELVKAGSNLDFVGKRRICAVVSIVLLAASLLAIPIRGMRFGVDFAGGVEMQVRFTGQEAVDEGRVRAVVGDLGIPNASVIRYGVGDTREFLIRFTGELDLPGVGAGPEAAAQGGSVGAAEEPSGGDAPALAPAEAAPAAVPAGAETGEAPSAAPAAAPSAEAAAQSGVVADLTRALGERIGAVEVERVEFVGPNVGAELRKDGLLAIAVACALILAYIWFRFSFRFAPGAVAALVHDVVITAGIFVIFGLEFDLRVLAALLALLGYSLNDTIIVYDRIRENMRLRTTRNLEDVLNQSVNQTLSRTLLTSGTTMIAVLALLLLGGEVIRPFALAMAIGILVGTYSSIYVAAPILLLLERWLQPATGKARPAKQTA